jgi:hypothetical protein
MTTLKVNQKFSQGLKKLGFSPNDESLFLIDVEKSLPDPQINFHIEKTREFQATAVFLRKQLNGSYKPQAYLFDYTGKLFKENELTDIQKVIWSSGEAPLACIFYDTEIKILNCTTHINDDNTPVYLIKDLQILGKAHRLYNEQFAVKLKGGTFWEEEENKNKFKFQNSSYDKLIENVRYIISHFKTQNPKISKEFINKIIVQVILIKYLEERIDDEGNKLLSNKYFKKYDNSNTFNDVLRKKGKLGELLSDLNDPKRGFNGNVFLWEESEKRELAKINLSLLAELLENRASLQTGQIELWRYFEFKFIPVELISRLYEEFLGEDKKDKGLYFTPSHLAKLLVDECIPLKNFEKIDPSSFKVLDPACGSGIFLVIAFKRLVQIWRLKNNMAVPDLSDLKTILRNLYGVDKEGQAVRLASFGLCLAICNELKPIDIINKLKFDDLTETNLINADFFDYTYIQNNQFDLVIGNPPFGLGLLENHSQEWKIKDEKIKIPQGQIALKFLSESFKCLKDGGLQCLIIKASGLLYNTTSAEYKRLLFSNFNVIQILDFTALGRNRALWDNGADVSSAAIFTRNEKPNFRNNILHLTFRRTRATKERIVFEIDDYDLHFINRQEAATNPYVWKNNLLGGGRISSLIKKFDLSKFQDYLESVSCKFGEGFKVGSKGTKSPAFVYKLKSLPTEAITEDKIDLSKLTQLNKKIKFEKLPQEEVFTAPNIVIWENIGINRLPVFLNNTSFSFQHKIIGISNKNKSLLERIVKSFKTHNDFYRFYIYATSGQLLVNLNTTILKTDIMNIPFIEPGANITFTEVEKNIINDVNNFNQEFLRHGEGSRSVGKIEHGEFKSTLNHYGDAFTNALNEIYAKGQKKFYLTDVIQLDTAYVATVFKYKERLSSPVLFHTQDEELNLSELSNFDLSKHLSVNRIIKLYPAKDAIIFIKPNQYRYWLASIAYRDADKCLSDLTKLGY